MGHQNDAKYYRRLVIESIEKHKNNSIEIRLKTIKNLEDHLKLQKINRIKMTETDKSAQIFLRIISLYKL